MIIDCHITFSPTFYFTRWHQHQSSYTHDTMRTWILGGFEDDAILVEYSRRHDIWTLYFSYFRPGNDMNNLVKLYTKMYGDISFATAEEAKDHINKFLLQLHKLKSFS